jgi:hypothetical protein
MAWLAQRARAEAWSHEESLVACLQREVSARESHGGEGRIRAARLPARRSLEEFDFDHARGLKHDVIAHLGTLDFVTARNNVVFLAPARHRQDHLAIGLAIRACQAGHRILFATASQSVARLAAAHTPAPCKPSWSAAPAIRCWSSTRSATSEPEAANLFSNSSPAATNAPPCSSPASSRSAAGAKCSATTSSLQP